MNRKLKTGFTLIELMVVVSLIIILAAVAVPTYQRYRESANKAKCISNLGVIHSAKYAWYINNQKEVESPVNPKPLPTTVAEIAQEGYFRGRKEGAQGPSCPDGGEYTLPVKVSEFAVLPPECTKADELEHVLGDTEEKTFTE